MSKTLSLIGGTHTINMLTGNLQVRIDGWEIQSVTGIGDPVWDTFSLVGRGATEAALGSAVYSAQTFFSQARDRANNISRDINHWIYYKPENGLELRTLVTDGNLMLEAQPGVSGLGPMMDSNGFLYATLAIQHMPWWEPATVDDNSYNSALNTLGGKWVPSIANGDLPGRIYRVTVANMTDTSYLDDFWIGIRPTYGGTTTFNSLWECEKGVIIAAAGATAVADGDASNGTAVRITFGTASMMQRMRIGVYDVGGTATPEDYTGKYLVLGRVKCGTSTECLIDLYQGLSQVGYGTAPAGIEMVGETKVTNNLYKLVELGQVQLPPYGLRVLEGGTAYNDVLSSKLYIYAQRLSGTSQLYLDALVMMPCEHMLTAKNAGIDNANDVLVYYGGADGKSICYMNDSTTGASEIIEHSVNNFVYPPDGGLIVFAAQATASHDATSSVGQMAFDVYPRYSLMKL